MNSQTQELEIVTDEEKPLIPKELELSVIQQDKSFETLMDDRRKLLTKVEKFDPVESVDDTPRMADAKRLQLDLAKNRNRVDDCLKAAGEGFRLKWKALCDVRRPLWLESESAEDWLKESSEFAIRFEASRRAELTAERAPQLLALGVDPAMYNLGEMSNQQWEITLGGAKLAKANADRDLAAQAEREKAEREERDRLRRENEKLMEEQRRKDAEALRERQEIQRKADADAAKARAEQARIKAEGDARIAEERRQREALERKEQERLQAEKQKEVETKKAAAKAAKAPDKLKLTLFADSLTECLKNIPAVKSDDAKAVTAWIAAEGKKFVSLILAKAENL